MIEILFRGKRKTDGEWVFGMPWIFKDHACICPWREGMCKYDTGFYPVHVDPATVGQFTGLTDKNGKKIFEDDICKVVRNGVTMFGIVEIYNGAFGLRFKSGEFNSFLYLKRSRPEGCWFDTLEVIGNIHDNPELLEVTE